MSSRTHYHLNIQQKENVLALPARERYQHFVRRVADWEKLWVLSDAKENLFIRTASTVKYLPVWPHPEYAVDTANLVAFDLTATEVDLYDFMDNWLPGLESDGLKVGVFPDLDGNVWIIEASDLRESLERECEQYE